MKAALFDLDGVVFNTEEQYTIFWGETSRRYHPEIPNLENIIKGSTLDQIFSRWFADVKDHQQEIIDGLNAFERNMDFNYILGFQEYITCLRKQGIKTAIVTSSNILKMESMYKKRPEVKSFFDAILTSEDFDKSKPDPDCYLKAAARLGCRPEDCVVYEDSFNGLKAGRAAGMKVIGLATTNTADAIRPFADIIISDFTELNNKNIEL